MLFYVDAYQARCYLVTAQLFTVVQRKKKSLSVASKKKTTTNKH